MISEKQQLIKSMLDLGEHMLASGAEINRVEDSLTRVGKTFGAVLSDVFVLTSAVNITLTFSDGTQETQTRRVLKSASIDFRKIEELNALCRKSANMNIYEFDSELQEIIKISPKNFKVYIGSVLAAGAFAVFFGGNIFDGIFAGVFALLICFLQLHFAKRCPNKVFFYLVSSVVIGLGIFACDYFLPMLNADKIIIGDIMLLIPGIAITNAFRDMIIGDTVSGIIKFAESLLWAISLAGGFMLAMSLWGGAFQ